MRRTCALARRYANGASVTLPASPCGRRLASAIALAASGWSKPAPVRASVGLPCAVPRARTAEARSPAAPPAASVRKGGRRNENEPDALVTANNKTNDAIRLDGTHTVPLKAEPSRRAREYNRRVPVPIVTIFTVVTSGGYVGTSEQSVADADREISTDLRRSPGTGRSYSMRP